MGYIGFTVVTISNAGGQLQPITNFLSLSPSTPLSFSALGLLRERMQLQSTLLKMLVSVEAIWAGPSCLQTCQDNTHLFLLLQSWPPLLSCLSEIYRPYFLLTIYLKQINSLPPSER